MWAFKEFFVKRYMAASTITLWNMKYRYVSDDKIFHLMEGVPAREKVDEKED